MKAILFLLASCVCAIAQFNFADPSWICQSPPAIGYTANSATFDGSNNYLTNTTTLNSIANAKLFTVSLWVKFNGGDGSFQYLFTERNGANILYRHADNKLYFNLRGVTTNPSIVWTSTGTYTSSSGWLHIIISLDASDTGKRWVYVNGSAAAGTWSTYLNENILYTGVNLHSVGSTHTGSNKLNGCLSEVWFDSQYTDVSANIDNWISGGHPVSLGSDGSTPTGTQPRVYLKSAYSSFQVNSGTGGDYSVAGTLSSCTSP